MVECLLSMHEAMDSVPSTAKGVGGRARGSGVQDYPWSLSEFEAS